MDKKAGYVTFESDDAYNTFYAGSSVFPKKVNAFKSCFFIFNIIIVLFFSIVVNLSSWLCAFYPNLVPFQYYIFALTEAFFNYSTTGNFQYDRQIAFVILFVFSAISLFASGLGLGMNINVAVKKENFEVGNSYAYSYTSLGQAGQSGSNINITVNGTMFQETFNSFITWGIVNSSLMLLISLIMCITSVLSFYNVCMDKRNAKKIEGSIIYEFPSKENDATIVSIDTPICPIPGKTNIFRYCVSFFNYFNVVLTVCICILCYITSWWGVMILDPFANGSFLLIFTCALMCDPFSITNYCGYSVEEKLHTNILKEAVTDELQSFVENVIYTTYNENKFWKNVSLMKKKIIFYMSLLFIGLIIVIINLILTYLWRGSNGLSIICMNSGIFELYNGYLHTSNSAVLLTVGAASDTTYSQFYYSKGEQWKDGLFNVTTCLCDIFNLFLVFLGFFNLTFLFIVYCSNENHKFIAKDRPTVYKDVETKTDAQFTKAIPVT